MNFPYVAKVSCLFYVGFLFNCDFAMQMQSWTASSKDGFSNVKMLSRGILHIYQQQKGKADTLDMQASEEISQLFKPTFEDRTLILNDAQEDISEVSPIEYILKAKVLRDLVVLGYGHVKFMEQGKSAKLKIKIFGNGRCRATDSVVAQDGRLQLNLDEKARCTLKNLDCKKLTAHISGKARAKFEGYAEKHTINTSGDCQVDTSKLTSRRYADSECCTLPSQEINYKGDDVTLAVAKSKETTRTEGQRKDWLREQLAKLRADADGVLDKNKPAATEIIGVNDSAIQSNKDVNVNVNAFEYNKSASTPEKLPLENLHHLKIVGVNNSQIMSGNNVNVSVCAMKQTIRKGDPIPKPPHYFKPTGNVEIVGCTGDNVVLSGKKVRINASLHNFKITD